MLCAVSLRFYEHPLYWCTAISISAPQALKTTEVRELTFRGQKTAWSIIAAIRIHGLSSTTQPGESAEWFHVRINFLAHLCASVNLRAMSDGKIGREEWRTCVKLQVGATSNVNLFILLFQQYYAFCFTLHRFKSYCYTYCFFLQIRVITMSMVIVIAPAVNTNTCNNTGNTGGLVGTCQSENQIQ